MDPQTDHLRSLAPQFVELTFELSELLTQSSKSEWRAPLRGETFQSVACVGHQDVIVPTRFDLGSGRAGRRSSGRHGDDVFNQFIFPPDTDPLAMQGGLKPEPLVK